MQVITVFAENHVALSSVDAGLLGKIYCKNIKVTLVKYLELLLQALLVIPKELLSQRSSSYDLSESLTLPSKVNMNKSPHSMNRSLTWDMTFSV